MQIDRQKKRDFQTVISETKRRAKLLPGKNSDSSSVGLGESEQRTFPAKTFPERCYGSDVWYPKCEVLIPHVLPPKSVL